MRLEIPFLGLHYFDEEHEQLFFGRDQQLRDLLAKLADSRFVTVIGSSGTGKSSLARAGLVPALRAGFFTAAGVNWRIVKTRPGSSPICNLASEIESLFSSTGSELTLRRGPLGLVEAAGQSGFRDDENLLIMVDQFEEIFRYQREAVDRQAATEEAASFVKLLLEATSRVEPAIFVLVTMRSDYLGACAQFLDLPERINTGLYLIPRMRRDQLEEAITGPAAIAGASFSPALVQRLLNDVGEDPDQLPVLQHALLRTWLNWKKDNNPSKQIDFHHYEATGGVRDGLDNHAEEIYRTLDTHGQKIAEVLFRSLTERDPSNNDIRRPTQLGVIAAIAAVTADEVRQVADAFRGEGASFLTPTSPTELHDGSVIDITHESLIRKWYRLRGTAEQKGWVQQEAELRDQYRDLMKRASKALLHQEVLTGSELDEGLRWKNLKLTPEWGFHQAPVEGAYGSVIDYIARSEGARNRQQKRRLITKVLVAVGLFVIGILIVVDGIKFHDSKQLEAQTLSAREAQRKEAALRAQAEQAERQAENARKDAEQQAARANERLAEAREARHKEEIAQSAAQESQSAAQSQQSKNAELTKLVPQGDLATIDTKSSDAAGIDVSHHIGNVDWSQVASSGARFAFVRATQGTLWVDPMFKQHWEKLHKVGIKRGAYHVLTADDPVKQADNFLATIGLLQDDDLPPALDIEDGIIVGTPWDSRESALDSILHWLERVEEKLGRRPVVYVGNSFLGTVLKGDAGKLVEYPLWLGQNGPSPKVATGWERWTFWQYSNFGKIGGILGTVDLDKFNGTKDDLLNFIRSSHRPSAGIR
jgi:GH25 family lysozyme M1 (1,4-beta-N-acetylmuramidase)